MTTQLDLVKRALAEIGTRTTITSMTDGSPEANYAALLYGPLRDFLLREADYDWAMVNVAATALAAPSPSFPWTYAYAYPDFALRIRQVIPAVVITNDPQPITWTVTPVAGVMNIWTVEQLSRILYTTSAVSEDSMDAIFQESFVRILGSTLAFALENRIEASQTKLNEAISFAGMANLRDS